MLYHNCHSGYVELYLYYDGDLAISFLCSFSECIIGVPHDVCQHRDISICLFVDIYLYLYLYIFEQSSLFISWVWLMRFSIVASDIKGNVDVHIHQILDFRQRGGKFWIVKHLSSICPKLLSSKLGQQDFQLPGIKNDM